MHARPITRYFAALALTLSALAGGLGATAHAEAANVPSLLSATPKTIVFDPVTMTVLSVKAGAPAISRHDTCNTNDACYYGEVPYANEGFYGSAGTYNGNWPERYQFGTGKYTAKACYSGGCTPKLGPASYTVFTTYETGTSVTIYS